VETRLQRLEEAQLYAQHDQEAMLAALEDLSQRFDTLLVKLTRLESRVQEAATRSENAETGDGAEHPREDEA
jgi:predicted  nucleic acid-binding Zn-ribbon protein